MNEAGIIPNIGTLNAAMESTCVTGNPKEAKKHALQVLSEFKSIGIEPSLGTYVHIMNLFCRERKYKIKLINKPCT